MIEGFQPLGPVQRPVSTGRTTPAKDVARSGAVENVFDPFPETPPAEVLKSLDHAQKVLAELEAKQVNLQFSVDAQSSRIHVKVMDGEGNLIREVPAVQALEVLSGDRSAGLGVDVKG